MKLLEHGTLTLLCLFLQPNKLDHIKSTYGAFESSCFATPNLFDIITEHETHHSTLPQPSSEPIWSQIQSRWILKKRSVRAKFIFTPRFYRLMPVLLTVV